MTRHRRRREVEQRGPPFVEIAGVLYLNLAFDLLPMGEDVRQVVGLELSLPPASLVLLQRLEHGEARLVRATRGDAEVEAWARLRPSPQPRRRS